MKFIKLLLLGLLPLAGLQAQEICKEVNNIAETERQNFDRKYNPELRSFASNNFDVYYYRCKWKVDPAVRYLTGNVTSYFKVTEKTASIIYDFTTQLTVDSVLYKNNKIDFLQNSNKTLTIYFPFELTRGRKDSVTIFYRGVPPTSGDFTGGFTQTSHSGTPIIWTLSEPYGASGWWPCKNGLSDKADSIDVYISAPQQYKATSNGMLQSERLDGTYKIAHYKHRYPIASYLVAFAVTNYSVFNRSVLLGTKNLPVISYVYPESLQYFEDNTAPVLTAMQLYHNSFGDYPFIKEKYGHTQFGWGGGMEHQTNSFISSPGENLMAHELAHQWFGDKITCGSWEDIWLNEGFATFCADFWYAENTNAATYKANVSGNLAYITALPNGSVWVNDTTSSGRIFDGRLTYDKGAFLLRMLRFTLGDSAFFAGIRQYLVDPKLQYGFARTKDLQRNLEQVSGMNLNYFFKQWFYGQGYPSFTVNWKQNNKGKIILSVSQTTSHPSVSFYKTPLPIVLKTGNTTKTIVLENTINNQNFVIDNPGFAVTELLIDPDKYLISKNNKSIKQLAVTAEDSRAETADNAALNKNITIYPNPVKDKLTIQLGTPSESAVLIQLFSSNGSTLWSKQVSGNTRTISIPFESYSKGVYMVVADYGGGKRVTGTVIK